MQLDYITDFKLDQTGFWPPPTVWHTRLGCIQAQILIKNKLMYAGNVFEAQCRMASYMEWHC